MSDDEQKTKRRNIGQYVSSGDWSDYWTTKISHARSGKINVRGYPVEELIENLTYSQSAFLLLSGELPDQRQASLFDLVLRSGMDQQFINAAAGAARFTASAFPESAIPALASGMLASGSITGSPQHPAEMLMQSVIADSNDDSGSKDTVTVYLQEGGAIPGLGHPLHKQGEPRAIAVRHHAIDLDGWGPHGQRLDAIEKEFEHQKGNKIPINLAGAIGAILADLKFDPLIIGGLGALVYGMSLLAHITEEIREGVPLRIIPKELGAHYAGPAERHLKQEKNKS